MMIQMIAAWNVSSEGWVKCEKRPLTDSTEVLVAPVIIDHCCIPYDTMPSADKMLDHADSATVGASIPLFRMQDDDKHA